MTSTGRLRLVAPATPSPTHRVSCFPPEVGPCSPTAQDLQATSSRGDSGGGWVSFGKWRRSLEAPEPGGPWAWLSLRPGEQRPCLSRYRCNYQHPADCERELVPEPLGSAVRQNHWMVFKCPGLHPRPVKFEFLEVGPRHRYFSESSPLWFWCAR